MNPSLSPAARPCSLALLLAQLPCQRAAAALRCVAQHLTGAPPFTIGAELSSCRLRTVRQLTSASLTSPSDPAHRASLSCPSPSLPAPELAHAAPRRPCPRHSSIVRHPWSLTGTHAPPSERIARITSSAVDATAQHTNWTIRASPHRDQIPPFTTRLKTIR
jgi:hypothetical protein